MRYYTFIDADGKRHLMAEPREGTLTDLTMIRPSLTELADLAQAAWLAERSIDEVALRLIYKDLARRLSDTEIDLADALNGASGMRVALPFRPPEVWAAGVTYKTSEMERRRESGTPDVYSQVYNAERPEVFFKATADRCVAHLDAVGIRADSNWNVPEPELAFVLYEGEIIGYTIGNDVSSRQIEGENPLYLPQAKVFDRCCAIGPCFASAETVGDAQALAVRCEIERGGEVVFSGETNTAQMARACAELADWLQRHNRVPNMTAVLTGTSIVPPPDFTLEPGDSVRIAIERIGTLVNGVVAV